MAVQNKIFGCVMVTFQPGLDYKFEIACMVPYKECLFTEQTVYLGMLVAINIFLSEYC